MNNKGFTLVELLATIVVISVIGGIAYTSVTSYINTSKIKAEEKFLDEISTEIESYLGLFYDKFDEVSDTRKELTKQISTSSTDTVDVWKIQIDDADDLFTLQDLMNDLKTTDEFKNPRTGGVCDAANITIEVYKDEDYVYYYYVEMTKKSIDCTALSDIDTRPADLRCKLGIIGACSDEG